MTTITLVSCVKSKRNAPAPARDLYTSPWFRAARARAETSGRPWYILSAKHGLVEPGTVLEPYEQTLNTMPVTERRRWAENVAKELLQRHPKADVEVLAGARYREFLAGHLEAAGWTVRAPLAATPGIGPQILTLRTLGGKA